jgi:hypothetical protein
MDRPGGQTAPAERGLAIGGPIPLRRRRVRGWRARVAPGVARDKRDRRLRFVYDHGDEHAAISRSTRPRRRGQWADRVALAKGWSGQPFVMPQSKPRGSLRWQRRYGGALLRRTVYTTDSIRIGLQTQHIVVRFFAPGPRAILKNRLYETTARIVEDASTR